MLILRNLYQKEFGARTRNQRNRIANAESQARAQIAKVDKWAERYNKTAENVSKNFGGDVEKFLEANPRMKGTYQNGPHREALDNILGGQKVAEQASINKHIASARKQVETVADQVHNYGKSRGETVRLAYNKFKTQGREFNVTEGKLGDVFMHTSKIHPENRPGDFTREWSRIRSTTNKRREVQVGRLDNLKKQSTEVLRRGGVTRIAPGSEASIVSKSANKGRLSGSIEEGNKLRNNTLFNEKGAVVLDKPLARPEIVKTPTNATKIKPEIVKTPTPTNATKIKPKSANKAHDVLVEEGNKISKNNFLKRNKKALLIGTGVAAAAGAGAVAYKHIKNRKDNKGK